jgi:hypothetical protein
MGHLENGKLSSNIINVNNLIKDIEVQKCDFWKDNKKIYGLPLGQIIQACINNSDNKSVNWSETTKDTIEIVEDLLKQLKELKD